MSNPEDSTPEDPHDQGSSQGDQELNARIERRLEDWFAPAPLSNDHLSEIHARLEAKPQPPRTLDGNQARPSPRGSSAGPPKEPGNRCRHRGVGRTGVDRSLATINRGPRRCLSAATARHDLSRYGGPRIRTVLRLR